MGRVSIHHFWRIRAFRAPNFGDDHHPSTHQATQHRRYWRKAKERFGVEAFGLPLIDQVPVAQPLGAEPPSPVRVECCSNPGSLTSGGVHFTQRQLVC